MNPRNFLFIWESIFLTPHPWRVYPPLEGILNRCARDDQARSAWHRPGCHAFSVPTPSTLIFRMCETPIGVAPGTVPRGPLVLATDKGRGSCIMNILNLGQSVPPPLEGIPISEQGVRISMPASTPSGPYRISWNSGCNAMAQMKSSQSLAEGVAGSRCRSSRCSPADGRRPSIRR